MIVVILSSRSGRNISLSNKEFIDYIVNDQCKMLISEFIELLKRNEMEIIKEVDTIGFIIEGLEKEGIQYILNDKKEWEEREK